MKCIAFFVVLLLAVVSAQRNGRRRPPPVRRIPPGARDNNTSNDRMGGTVASIITDLERDGYLTGSQADFIRQRYPDDAAEDHSVDPNQGLRPYLQDEMWTYLDGQVKDSKLSPETRRYVAALLKLSREADLQAVLAPESSDPAESYAGNGIVTLQGTLDPAATSSPPTWSFYSESRYNGIWGYSTGDREYALQCHSDGLYIIDITDPTTPYQVQFIAMAGGDVWRDAETYQHADGKTYAYVAAQSDGNLFVVDLSPLSGSTPMKEDAAECPYVDRGRKNYGHTLTVRDGLLFLNSANSQGCQIFELDSDPWDPKLISKSYEGSQRDCHDSVARNGINVPGSGERNILFSADGRTGQYRMVDITDVASGSAPVVIGETEDFSPSSYAHAVTLSEDSKYLYVFEEFNEYDMAVFDISDPRSPVLIRTFAHPDESFVVHNGQVRGDFLFVAYYEAGFRVYDISDPTNPVERGKYETYIDTESSGLFSSGKMKGAWNVYSYLPSGNILISDQQSGLFIFQVDGVIPVNPTTSPPTAPVAPTTSPPTSRATAPPTSQTCTNLEFSSYMTCDLVTSSSSTFCSEYWSPGLHGQTAMTACCVCGGGHWSSDPSVPVSQPCTDMELDSYFLSCEFSSVCYDWWPAGENGLKPLESCCSCGGGIRSSESSSPGQPATPAPTPQPCTDIEFSNIFTCDYFSSLYCPDEAWSFYLDGQTPFTACCVCGGGKRASNPSSPSVPVPITPVNDPSKFNIELLNMGTNTQYDAAFWDAKSRWESIITNDLEGMPAKLSSSFDWFDGEFSTPVNRDVDDVLIGYEFKNIDGYGDTLGMAGPRYWREDDFGKPSATISGIMIFDSSDFAYMSHEDATIIILHEMGHVLGLGTFWELKCGESCPSDYSYTCPKAAKAYKDLGIGDELLLSNDGGKGSRCSHWDDESFSSFRWSDVMTPVFVAYKDQLITSVDLAALEDLGGYVVDYDQADLIPNSNNIFGRSGTTKSIKRFVPTTSFSLENRMMQPPMGEGMRGK